MQNFEKAAALYQLAHQIGKYSSIMQKLGDQSANDVKVGPSSPTQARCGEWITIEASGDLALGSRIVAAGHSGSQERHGATSARASAADPRRTWPRGGECGGHSDNTRVARFVSTRHSAVYELPLEAMRTAEEPG